MKEETPMGVSYPSIGERVYWDGRDDWEVQAIDPSGNVSLRYPGMRLDEICLVPPECIRRIATPEQIRTALKDLDALGHGRADRAQAWLRHLFGDDFMDHPAVRSAQ
jgi:hypothetical protein